ncbi:uncharacterized protein LOC107839113 isoform X3 [Capsicum annuum]|uniref:uncharacterized protein LOC107839113 isoform X3 n=1 Tax=Capsicum annuum TaxID=4072 RepID=UPI001FB0EA9D|nr:uncharacterized protein LOC107839113 isoform X3 [Capsicum annuum]XP_047251801.1 uncharacterized protein LOC107839113 isoform X3 [Capsicum annuum]
MTMLLPFHPGSVTFSSTSPNLLFTIISLSFKGGVSSEEVSLKYLNNLENIVEKMKRKDLRKSSSPNPTKNQKSMKKMKSDEKGESSKIASLFHLIMNPKK